MKKLILTAVGLLFVTFASAQALPDFQFGVKAGANFTKLSDYDKFSSEGQAGYLAGFYARVGALGLFFQPEIYVAQKDVNTTYTESSNEVFKSSAKFTSLDVPLLVGEKLGAFGFGTRLYTGPVISFAINKNQSFSQAAGEAARLQFKDQNLAWQFGAGIDIRWLAIDLRYEAGLNKIGSGPNAANNTRINMFNLTLGYYITSFTPSF